MDAARFEPLGVQSQYWLEDEFGQNKSDCQLACRSYDARQHIAVVEDKLADSC